MQLSPSVLLQKKKQILAFLLGGGEIQQSETKQTKQTQANSAIYFSKTFGA